MNFERMIKANNLFQRQSRTTRAKLARSDMGLRYFRKPFVEVSCNIDHDRKFIFLHNPKTAGTSIKNVLGITLGLADHRTPTQLVHHKTWELYFSFVVVRNPFDRLVSSYAYHTNPGYRGWYLKIYPYLHDLGIEDYFDLRVNEPRAKQVDYLQHRFSDKKVDFVLHYETLEQEIEPVLQRLGITSKLPHYNKNPHEDYKIYFEDKTFRSKVQAFYQADLDEFNYVF